MNLSNTQCCSSRFYCTLFSLIALSLELCRNYSWSQTKPNQAKLTSNEFHFQNENSHNLESSSSLSSCPSSKSNSISFCSACDICRTQLNIWNNFAFKIEHNFVHFFLLQRKKSFGKLHVCVLSHTHTRGANNAIELSLLWRSETPLKRTKQGEEQQNKEWSAWDSKSTRESGRERKGKCEWETA